MKKILSICACLAMVLVGGLTLAACCGNENDYITAGNNASLAGSSVVFQNAEGFELVYDGDNHYTASGSTNVMNAEQSAETSYAENSKFVVVNVKTEKDATSVVGWRNNENKDTAFSDEEKAGEGIIQTTSANDTKNFIIVLSDGDTYLHAENTIWRIEVSVEGEEMVAYTIDLSSLYVTE